MADFSRGAELEAAQKAYIEAEVLHNPDTPYGPYGTSLDQPTIPHGDYLAKRDLAAAAVQAPLTDAALAAWNAEILLRVQPVGATYTGNATPPL